MIHEDPDCLRQILWPHDRNGSSGDIFALLDCARDQRIYPLIKRQQINYSCLFAGDLPQELAEAAPYLVALSPHSRLTEALLTQGWGQSWGVFLESAAMLPDLRRHFRRFLEVRDEQGRRLLFRYYDPRVLQVYLPNCNEDEQQALFGPVDRFVLEDEDSHAPTEFRVGKVALTESAFLLGAIKAASHLRLRSSGIEDAGVSLSGCGCEEATHCLPIPMASS
jgi:Domain of unknown function (DUF4123)